MGRERFRNLGRGCVAASLRNLQTDYVDCLVVHSPLPTETQTLQAWRAIEEIIDVGGIRQAGISNCYNLAEFEERYQTRGIKRYCTRFMYSA